jgi:hypothetical protein
LERLIEWALPVAEEIGAAQWLSVPSQNSAERQIARNEEGAMLTDIYAEIVAATAEAAAAPRSLEPVDAPE